MEKQRIKVLHVLSSNRFSGAENVVCQIINMFSPEQQYEMVYCSPDGQIRDALTERAVPFAALNKLTVSEIKRVIKEVQPTLIHAHDMRASFLVSLACGKIPYISHIHNNNFDSRGLTAKAVAFRLAAIKAKHILWVSKSSFEGYYFKETLAKKSTVLYNVLDVEQIRKRADEADGKAAYDILYVGRITRLKNPERLIGVLHKAVQRDPSIRAGIIGTGELEEETKALIAQKKLGENIAYLGFISNPHGMLKNAGAMIMTSLSEGTPMCALEAMALGVPIVSTPVGGLCELVQNGQTGYLSEDDDELAQRCVEISRDPQLRAALSQATTAAAEQMMDINTYRQKMDTVYKNHIK